MTDRYFCLTMALEKDIREDDAQQIINAIEMIRGVIKVDGNISDMNSYVAEERVRRELGNKLIEVVFPELKR